MSKTDEKNETAKTSARAKPRPSAKAPEKVVYIGPSRPGIMNGSALIGGYTPAAQRLIDADKRLKRLFVPVSGVAKARQDIKKGGALSELCKIAQGVE
ncbi:hypothetical protein [Limisalsivibrio acetivorans]|uniref:hypothetical protein n=1 Tax=Limisalsivibrio acetivorans TaxID=1304888 RepID=UPI0003B622FA|nr:hypothetical protein [Limisalsivibrio acetivorans]